MDNLGLYYPRHSPPTDLYENEYKYEYKLGGTYFAIDLGLNYKNFDFGIELSFMGITEYKHEYDKFYFNDYITHYLYQYNDIATGLKLKFGYNFPVNVKKK